MPGEPLCLHCRVAQVVTARELGCAGTGQRATRAVILRGKARPVEGLDTAIGREELILNQITACLICAGQQDSADPGLQQRLRGPRGVLMTAETTGLGSVWGDQCRLWKQLIGDQRGNLAAVEVVAASGGQHWVEDHGSIERSNQIAERHHQFDRPDQADFDGIRPDIPHQDVELVFEKAYRRRMEGMNISGILHSQGRHQGHCLAAERRYRLDVGLDPGATRWIEATDTEDAWTGGHCPGILPRLSARTAIQKLVQPGPIASKHLAKSRLGRFPGSHFREDVNDMKQYMCVICGYIYDEAKGIPDEDIAPGTRWEDVPLNWQCPECGAGKEDFEMVEI